MFISNSRKFIFFHVPKSAGTSLSQLFESGQGWNDIALGGTVFGEVAAKYYSKKFKLSKHVLPAQCMRVLGNDLYSNYFKFCFFRDPIKRFISASQFFINAVKFNHDWTMNVPIVKKFRKEIISFETLSNVVNSNLLECLSAENGPKGDIYKMFAPQSIYLSGKSEYLYSESSGFSCVHVYLLSEFRCALDDLVRRGFIFESEIRSSGVESKGFNKSSSPLVNDLCESSLARLNNLYQADFEVIKLAGSFVSR